MASKIPTRLVKFLNSRATFAKSSMHISILVLVKYFHELSPKYGYKNVSPLALSGAKLPSLFFYKTFKDKQF